MQTRTGNGLAFGAAAVVAAVGLGTVARHSRPPALGSRALDAIPAGALLVATVDLGVLRASPLGAPFLREGREIKGLGKVRDVCGFDPIDTLSEVAIAIPAASDEGDFGLVGAGPIDDEALIACASKVIDARGGHAVTTAIGSFRSVRDANLPTGGGEIAVKRGGPLLLGAGAYLRAMIDAADGRAPTIRSSAAHGFLGRAVGEAPVRVTVVLTPEERRAVADELESGARAADPAGSIRAGALGVTLGPTVALHAILSCETAPACSALATKLASARDARAQDVALRIVGFGAVLERVALVPEGDLIHARVELPAEEAATLVERVLALRGLRHPMPGGEASVAPSTLPPLRPDAVIKPDTAKARTVDGGAGADPGARGRGAPR